MKNVATKRALLLRWFYYLENLTTKITLLLRGLLLRGLLLRGLYY